MAQPRSRLHVIKQQPHHSLFRGAFPFVAVSEATPLGRTDMLLLNLDPETKKLLRYGGLDFSSKISELRNLSRSKSDRSEQVG